MSLLRVAVSSWECFDDAAMVLEEIAPEDKTRNEVLGARVNLSPGGQEMGYGRSGCQPSRKG